MSNVDIFNILKKYFLQGKTTAAGSAGLKLFLEWRQKNKSVSTNCRTNYNYLKNNNYYFGMFLANNYRQAGKTVMNIKRV